MYIVVNASTMKLPNIEKYICVANACELRKSIYAYLHFSSVSCMVQHNQLSLTNRQMTSTNCAGVGLQTACIDGNQLKVTHMNYQLLCDKPCSLEWLQL